MTQTRRLAAALTMAVLAVPSVGLGQDGQSLANGEKVKIVKVDTADTLVGEVESSGLEVTVRVLGIDCPHSTRGFSLANRHLLDETVTLESDREFLPILQNRRGQFVAYIRLPAGEDYGELMISNGACTDETWNIPHPRADAYEEARESRG